MSDLDRKEILKRVRGAIAVVGDETGRLETVRNRLAQHQRSLIPARAEQNHDQLLALFEEMLQAVEATTARVVADNLATEINRYLVEQRLPLKVRSGSDPLINAIDWTKTPMIEQQNGPAAAGDAVSLTHAFAAAAETGTLFLASGPANPVTLSFLPEANIVLVRMDDVVGSYEEAFDVARRQFGVGQMPRTLNLVSGPSRTADIEQTLITGAHGPRRLHAVIVS